MGAKLQAAGGGGKKSAPKPNTEPNVIPFIDILLVLLIIFMVAAPAPTVDVNIDLPPPTQNPNSANNAKPVFLFIDANGNLSISGVGINADQIQEELYKAIRAVNPNTPNPFEERVFVRGDLGLPYREVLKVMDEVMGAGYYKVGLVTEDVDGVPAPTP